jgi:hypothetical protein
MWEYLEVVAAPDDLIRELNKAGAKEWELCYVRQSPSGFMVAYMKRETVAPKRAA